MENSSRSHIPSICIVGRPNVGKSSLFNQIIGKRTAVVVEQSGTTRDRVETVVNLRGRNIKIVDTGGYAAEDKDELSLQVKEQIREAMEESSVILLVTDTQSGISPADREIADILRKFSKAVVLVANKTDNDKLLSDVAEFYQLGFGDPVAVSCVHKRGIARLKKLLKEAVSSEEGEFEEKHYIKIAVVGRPNVGKSSFINNLLARKRVIVSDVPGTTRDSIDTYFSYENEDYILIDTAGIRHRRKVKNVVDAFSIMRSKESIARSDVAVLILDAKDGITRDDIGILRFIEEKGKACLLVVNKWDLAEEVKDVTIDEYRRHLVYAEDFLKKYPIEFISAKTGKNVIDTLSVINVLDANLDLKVSTPFLNKLLEKDDPSLISIPRRKMRPNFLYMTQTRQRPLEFTVFVNNPSNVLQVHLSFIENKLRESLPLNGIPVKIKLKKSRKERK